MNAVSNSNNVAFGEKTCVQESAKERWTTTDIVGLLLTLGHPTAVCNMVPLNQNPPSAIEQTYKTKTKKKEAKKTRAASRSGPLKNIFRRRSENPHQWNTQE